MSQRCIPSVNIHNVFFSREMQTNIFKLFFYCSSGWLGGKVTNDCSFAELDEEFNHDGLNSVASGFNLVDWDCST